MKTKLRNQKGFTIIEVLIVLAIAGLILLIVFLAVPALQRNSRNTSIKNDVAALLGGVSEYQAANNGSMPTTAPQAGSVVTFGALNTTTANVQGSTVVAVSAAAVTVPGTINVQFGNNCAGTGGARNVAARFAIERGGGAPVSQCQDS